MFPADTKFLVVDDSGFTRNMVKKSLAELGYKNVFESADVLTAQDILTKELASGVPIHCIISDVNMPALSGLSLVQWVRDHKEIKNMPLLLLTCNHEKEDVLEAARMGVTQYMVKPFDTNTIRDRLEGAWKKHGKKYFDSIPKPKVG